MEKFSCADPPFKFEAGTPNIAQAIGLGEAIRFFNEINTKTSHKYLNELTNYLLEELLQIEATLMDKSRSNQQ